MIQILGYTTWSFSVLLAVIYCIEIWQQEALESSSRSYYGSLTGTLGLLTQSLALFSMLQNSKKLDDWMKSLQDLVSKFQTKRKQKAFANPSEIVALPLDLHLNISEYLSVVDIVNVSACCQYWDQAYNEGLWHQVYRLRYDAGHPLSVKVNLQSPVFGDTMMFRLERFVLIPFFGRKWKDSLPKYEKIGHPPRSSWKGVCLARLRGHDTLYCTLCQQLEVFHKSIADWESNLESSVHGTTTWITYCSCQLHMHRSCFENVLNQQRMPCSDCGQAPSIGTRLPCTFREVWTQFCRAGRGWAYIEFEGLAVVVSTMYLGGGLPLDMVITVLLYRVFKTEKYDACVRAMWFGHNGSRVGWNAYFTLYNFYSAFGVFMALMRCSRVCAQLSFVIWLRPIFSTVFILIGIVLLLVFHNSEYRIKTANLAESDLVDPHQPRRCILCLLHVCHRQSRVSATTTAR